MTGHVSGACQDLVRDQVPGSGPWGRAGSRTAGSICGAKRHDQGIDGKGRLALMAEPLRVVYPMASRKPVRGFGSAAVGPVTTLLRGGKFTGDSTLRMLFSPLAVHRPSIKGKR